ncbi:MAG TPA: cytochrome c oxidase assembly protein [Gemmatimonadaceae bacterium]|nr:cytochrome c oxidase assembly protein [Gemmatimonadaceae bacterium]
MTLGVTPDPSGFVWEWEWELSLIASLIASQVAYVVCWFRGGLAPQHAHLAWKHLAAFTAGLVIIVIALASPIGANDERLLSMHMVAHDLLIWVAAPILVVGGVPLLGDTNRLPRYLRQALERVTSPLVALLASTTLLWVWHAPAAFDRALANDVVHGIEHLCFLIGYVLYWWPLVVGPQAIGRLRGHLARAVYLLVGMMQSALLSALIMFHGTVLYTRYLHVPGATLDSAVADQRLAGALMWYPGAVVFALAAAFAIREHGVGPLAGSTVSTHQRDHGEGAAALTDPKH